MYRACIASTTRSGSTSSTPSRSNARRLTYPLAAAVGQLHLYALRTDVRGVFAKLLDHRGGAVDDLPGGDLLRHEGV